MAKFITTLNPIQTTKTATKKTGTFDGGQIIQATHLKELQGANKSHKAYPHKPSTTKPLGFIKSVLRGVVSSVAGCQIQSLSIHYFYMLIGIPKDKRIR